MLNMKSKDITKRVIKERLIIRGQSPLNDEQMEVVADHVDRVSNSFILMLFVAAILGCVIGMLIVLTLSR